MSTKNRSDDRALGLVLLIVGALVILIKAVPWVTLGAIASLWPLILIYLGINVTIGCNT